MRSARFEIGGGRNLSLATGHGRSTVVDPGRWIDEPVQSLDVPDLGVDVGEDEVVDDEVVESLDVLDEPPEEPLVDEPLSLLDAESLVEVDDLVDDPLRLSVL